MNQQRTNSFARDVTIGALGAILATLITWVVTLAAPAVFIKGLGGVTQAEFESYKMDIKAYIDDRTRTGGGVDPSDFVTLERFNKLDGRVRTLEDAPPPTSSGDVDLSGFANQAQVDEIGQRVTALEGERSVDPAALESVRSDVSGVTQRLEAVENKTQYIERNDARDGATRIRAGGFLFVLNSSDGRITVHSDKEGVVGFWDDKYHGP